MSRNPVFVPNPWWSIGFYLAAIAWFGLVGVGFILVTTPETGRHSHIIGWALLVVGAGVMISTMDRWIRYAQVFLGFGIVGGLASFARGHLLGSQVPFPRPVAAVVVLVLIGCSLIIGTLANRPLRMIDRLGITAFVAALGSALFTKGLRGLMFMFVGLAVLLAVWAYQWFLERKASSVDSPN